MAANTYIVCVMAKVLKVLLYAIPKYSIHYSKLLVTVVEVVQMQGGAQIFQKTKTHIKILSVRTVTFESSILRTQKY